MFFLLLIITFLQAYMRGAHAQIEGPNADGIVTFFFNNYTGAMQLRGGVLPSIEIHPVLGGIDIKYIRYDNWMACNFTSLKEVDPYGNAVAIEYPLELHWTFEKSEEVNSTTGNVHYKAGMNTTASNGAVITLLTETWSQGTIHQYGSYSNDVPASNVEISFIVTGWPFKDTKNEVWIALLLTLDGPAIPEVTLSDYKFAGTLSTSHASFSVVMMLFGLVDGELTPAKYGFDVDISDLSSYLFTVKLPYFRQELQYDPNFEVLLNNQPDCSMIHACSNGVCVENDVCACNPGYTGIDCDGRTGNTTPQESDEISKTIYIATAVGGFVIVVVVATGLVLWRSCERKKSPHSLNNIRKSSNQTQVPPSPCNNIANK